MQKISAIKWELVANVLNFDAFEHPNMEDFSARGKLSFAVLKNKNDFFSE